MNTSARRLLLLAIMGLFLATVTALGEDKQTAARKKIVVLQGAITAVSMDSRRAIRTVDVENEKCIQAGLALRGSTAVSVKSVAPGTSRHWNDTGEVSDSPSAGPMSSGR